MYVVYIMYLIFREGEIRKDTAKSRVKRILCLSTYVCERYTYTVCGQEENFCEPVHATTIHTETHHYQSVQLH